LREDNVDTIAEDIDRQSAMYVMNALVPIKSGVLFSKLSINVGGWQQSGPRRRDFPNWYQRRSRGRKPERLFIFERSTTDTLLFREHAPGKPWVL
jgi:hypothetical protein